MEGDVSEKDELEALNKQKGELLQQIGVLDQAIKQFEDDVVGAPEGIELDKIIGELGELDNKAQEEENQGNIQQVQQAIEEMPDS